MVAGEEARKKKLICEQSFLSCRAFIAMEQGGRWKVVAASVFSFPSAVALPVVRFSCFFFLCSS